MQELYGKNYRILLKDIKEDLTKWRDKPCLWIRRFNTVKMSHFLLIDLESM